MAWLPDGEKISRIGLLFFTEFTNVTDRQTDGHRMTAHAALMHGIARQKIAQNILYCIVNYGHRQ